MAIKTLREFNDAGGWRSGIHRIAIHRGRRVVAVWLALLTPVLFPAFRACGQDSRNLAEWKAHFTNALVIEDCVFERITRSPERGSRTNLYQFKYQANASLIRELMTLNEAASNYIPRMGFYAVHYGSNYWDIAAGEILELFPDIQKLIQQGESAAGSVYAAGSIITSALYYGINQLDPATVRWQTATRFTAASTSGERLTGEILQLQAGLPQSLSWHYDNQDDRVFFLEYGYGQKLGLTYYPSEIKLYPKYGDDAKYLACSQRILYLTAAAAPLPETVFAATNYFRPRANLGGSSILIYTNHAALMPQKNGGLARMPRISDLSPVELGFRISPVTKLVYFGLLALTVLGFYFLWKHSTTTKNQRTHK